VARRVYELLVSGGKDSVVAATVAHEEARERGIECRVVHIDELRAFRVPDDALPYKPLDYVRRFAEWLGAELVVLEPGFDFWEGVKRWGYPHVFHNRWCMLFLKRKPLEKYAWEEVRRGRRPVFVAGIRRGESPRRAEVYTSKWMVFDYGGLKLENYYPILDWSDRQVEEFIRKRGIPENPLWKLGFSFECFCLAGASIRQLNRIIAEFPELAKFLAEMDKEVNQPQYRRSGTVGLPTPLYKAKIPKPLWQYVEERLRQRTLLDFARRGGGVDLG
jgi:3'-phosphoadenosine 5'-phosphosulfate sulfotransferase (PAPS reductase)/FAD synthetase